MRVVVMPGDLGRCGYRLIWPALALRAQGADVEIVPPDVKDSMHPATVFPPSSERVVGVWSDRDDGSTQFHGLHHRPDCDIVVVQRPLQESRVRMIEALQAAGVKVVVEIDDDFRNVSRRNQAWSSVHPQFHPWANWQHLAEACRIADLVTVTTPALARLYGSHGRVAIIPNHVPRSYLDVGYRTARAERPSVGWSGSLHTHPDDLQVMRRMVRRVQRETGCEIRVVGTGAGVSQVLGVPHVLATGWVPLSAYPVMMAQMDVGLVPLELSLFNEAKSGLKGLEFAALGVPYVASPTGPYRQQTEHAGLLAEKPADWYRHLRQLVNSEDYRKTEAARGRAWAATQTVEGNCDMWWDAWGKALA